MVCGQARHFRRGVAGAGYALYVEGAVSCGLNAREDCCRLGSWCWQLPVDDSEGVVVQTSFFDVFGCRFESVSVKFKIDISLVERS